ncbi:hypothetical protein ADIMK_1767 [Marinobacterium lacunae]|uniref:DUF2149 domain-containing protein n=1 Tax=Marinobacterium lacunae TaxID=1232683 RepID=A0A081FZS7_9GAMM|nr:DUF2149 domain-containing protein [Marinobacterium lacunae]KEA64032.1 hypothetical protein ADIMK_1767 [Marinobacterium lacunae]MBR9885623.1 DUF2149 domain-containing protein [Oceanospirillales bacterium]
MNGGWRQSRFDQELDEPLGPLANLLDLMLVFACGLIAALVAQSPSLAEHFKPRQAISQGRELPQMPKGMEGAAGQGFESVGQVYRDPKTGKLILIGD